MTPEIQRAASDIKPTMTDQAVLDFCKTGIHIVEEVIPEATNRWVTEYLDQEGATPNELVRDKRYIEEVLLHPEVAGAARSLLGENCQLPDWMANHRLVGPTPAKQWHVTVVQGSSGHAICCRFSIFPNQILETWDQPYFCPDLTSFLLQERSSIISVT